MFVELAEGSTRWRLKKLKPRRAPVFYGDGETPPLPYRLPTKDQNGDGQVAGLRDRSCGLVEESVDKFHRARHALCFLVLVARRRRRQMRPDSSKRLNGRYLLTCSICGDQTHLTLARDLPTGQMLARRGCGGRRTRGVLGGRRHRRHRAWCDGVRQWGGIRDKSSKMSCVSSRDFIARPCTDHLQPPQGLDGRAFSGNPTFW